MVKKYCKIIASVALLSSCDVIFKSDRYFESYISNWNPRERDGESIDLILELRNDLKRNGIRDSISLPKNNLERYVTLKCVYENNSIVSLIDHDGLRLDLDNSIMLELNEWLRIKPESISVNIIARKSDSKKNSAEVVAIAIEGGPLFTCR